MAIGCVLLSVMITPVSFIMIRPFTSSGGTTQAFDSTTLEEFEGLGSLVVVCAIIGRKGCKTNRAKITAMIAPTSFLTRLLSIVPLG